MEEGQKKLAAHLRLPTGYSIEWGGAFENMQRAMARLRIIVPITIGLIFFLLFSSFNSLRHAGLIIANLPFSFIGGIVALLGLLPLAFANGIGSEVQRPLATVVIGGLLSSTLLTLVVLPVLYQLLETRRSLLHRSRQTGCHGPAADMAPLALPQDHLT